MENQANLALGRLRMTNRLLDRLGDRLVNMGLITQEQLKQALDRQSVTKEFIGEALISLGYISPAQISPYLAEITGFPFFDIGEERIDVDVAKLIPEAYSRAKTILPFRDSGNKIHVAMADPLNLAVVDEVRSMLSKPMVPYLGFQRDIEEAIRRTYDAKSRAQALLEEIQETTPATAELADNLADQAAEAPIVRLVNSLIQGAITVSASDVHVEPQEDTVRVRYRIDGLLYEQMTIPLNLYPAVISRLKIVSNLDIAERRRAQDGRLAMKDDSGRDFDVRLSIMPTVHGEKACMRILETKSKMGSGTLDRLGLYPEQRGAFERMVRKPHGIILATGPTGSGKSTSLYAALQLINSPHININTIEDPVEYKLPGVNQTQVNHKINVTFATGLRTLVRQDPDVILVGEIRDSETAEIAVQAALTGHLVLSTLHTNDAPGALVRLQNMGVEPFLLSSAIISVIGQRLLRTVCLNCRTLEPLSAELESVLRLPPRDEPYMVARGVGCRRCAGRGTIGRIGVYEIMPMTDALRNMVLSGASGSELLAQAVKDGMQTIRMSAVRRMLDHLVSPEELLRVLSSD